MSYNFSSVLEYQPCHTLIWGCWIVWADVRQTLFHNILCHETNPWVHAVGSYLFPVAFTTVGSSGNVKFISFGGIIESLFTEAEIRSVRKKNAFGGPKRWIKSQFNQLLAVTLSKWFFSLWDYYSSLFVNWNDSAFFTSILWAWNKMLVVKFVPECLTDSKHSKNFSSHDIIKITQNYENCPQIICTFTYMGSHSIVIGFHINSL